MFWGLIVQPNKKYSQKVKRSFHLSHAVLDVSKTAGDEDVKLVLTTDNNEYILCILKKSKTAQVPLDLMFSEGDEIAFTSVGGTIHLTGYLEEQDYDDVLLDSDEDEDPAPPLIPLPDSKNQSKKNQKHKKPEEESSGDDDDDDDFKEGDNSDDNSEMNDSSDDEAIDEDDDEEEGEDEEEEDESEEEQQPEPPKKKKKVANGVANGKPAKEEKSKPALNEKKKKTDTATAVTQKAKKSLPGGVQVEEIRAGKGPEAKTGKKVQVYYEGRLKSNNKVFDKTLNGDGFKFKLGQGEVIKGWDVGIVGMKVGSKRRIVCPPNMAYGAKGSPPVIPPNSTLVFDVELRGVS